jgi:hypothetical protein
MVAAPAFSVSNDFFSSLDEMLFEICEELQISPSRHDLVVGRYGALNKLLESGSSPFRQFRPEIYPQGSMALGTTVQPMDGSPHDLDFVLELSNYLRGPMQLISELYEYLGNHGIYGPMTTLKNRCVRVTYADEFYMDVLPAVRNPAAGTCVKVPDCASQGWSDSNPRGYIKWFKDQSRKLLISRILDRAAPIPSQQAVEEKATLQLVVQLLKRWRDLYYSTLPAELSPISIVLTTLAADTYRGERSVGKALTEALDGIAALIDASRRAREAHIHLSNPSNLAEDLTERWSSNPAAYLAFEQGIRKFREGWTGLLTRGGNVNSQLERLFGETVGTVLKKRARKLQESRLLGGVGVTSSGLLVPSAAASVSARPNTFYGEG